MAATGDVPFEKFLTTADTGDVVLFAGTESVSRAVEVATWSIYSHSALVIKDPTTGLTYLFQSNFEACGADPLSPVAVHSGVQAGPLAEAVQRLYVEGDFPTWRRLAAWPGRDDHKVWEAAREIDGNQFPVVWKRPGELDDLATLALIMTIWYEGRYANNRILDPIFCSGAVAYVLQGAGILDGSEHPPNAYEPKDYSSMYPGFARWTDGVVWDDDRVIAMPPTTGSTASP
jgi:hypothetical protein